MTSNIGAKEASSAGRTLGFASGTQKENDFERTKEAHVQALKSAMKPEIVNRIDEIVVFKKLDKDSLVRIAELMLTSLTHRLAQRGVNASFSERAKDYIVSVGYDSEYGARPLRRTIQRLVEDKLSEKIIKGEILSGDKVKVDFDGEQLTFGKD